MDKLKELQNELVKLRDKANEIEEKAKKEERQLTGDEYRELNEILDHMDEVEAMARIEERKIKKFADLEKATEKPVTHEEGIRNEDNGGFKSFGEYLQAVIRAGMPRAGLLAGKPCGVIDSRLYELQSIEERQTGQAEVPPALGGFLVTTDQTEKILDRTYQTGVLAARCTRFTISRTANSISFPRLDETSRADGSRWGGIRVYWTEEAAQKTGVTTKFGKLNLNLHKLTGLIYLTDELLEDASALEAYVIDKFGDEFGFKIDDAIINGTGVGQPMGILSANCTVQVSKETGQTAATILAENIEKMYARMWAPSIKNSIWLINQDCWPQIFQLHHAVGTGGVPVFVPAGGLSQSPYGTLMGRPILPIEQCKTLGTVGDIYFVDLKHYYLAEKGGIKSARSIHLKFDYDETVLRFVMRIDGQPSWSAALTPYQGSNTQSPFIKLATRS